MALIQCFLLLYSKSLKKNLKNQLTNMTTDRMVRTCLNHPILAGILSVDLSLTSVVEWGVNALLGGEE